MSWKAQVKPHTLLFNYYLNSNFCLQLNDLLNEDIIYSVKGSAEKHFLTFFEDRVCYSLLSQSCLLSEMGIFLQVIRNQDTLLGTSG